MALNFEYEKDLSTGAQPFISHEKDSILYNYYIVDEKALDRSASAPGGYYDNVVFENEERHLTTKAVSRIGIKNFPGIGGMGFYKDAYSDECHIVAPIHTNKSKYGAPVLTKIEVIDNKLHIVITPPGDLEYTCYRVVVKQQQFAFEYITYKADYYVDLPTVKGDYVAYCIGYDEETGVFSENSNELNLTITTGSEDWSPDSYDTSEFERRITELEDDIGDIGAILDDINGVEV